MPVPLPVVLLVAAILVVAVWAVRADLRRKRQQVELLTTMGLRPIEQPDPQDAEALLAVFRHGPVRSRRLRLDRTFGRDCPGGHLYVFDVRNPGQKRSLIASSAVGVVRRGAGLPAMEIRSLGEQGAAMPEWMVSMIGTRLGPGKAVDLPDDVPEFSRRFKVFAPEDAEAAVRRLLTAEVRRALLEFHFLSLDAGGDAFALQSNPFLGPKRGDEVGALRTTIEEAGRVARALEPQAEVVLQP